MDDFGCQLSIRAKALDKLSLDAAQIGDDEDMSRLLRAIDNSKDQSDLPIVGKEFEVLTALANAAQYVSDPNYASILAKQLYPYFLESPTQEFTGSLLIRRNGTPPWQIATHVLTCALIHLQPRTQVIGTDFGFVFEYLDKVESVLDSLTDSNRSGKVVSCLFSLQGFLIALSEHAYSVDSNTALKILQRLSILLQYEKLTQLEAVISSVRSESFQSQYRETLWLHYFNHYADTEKEPGSILLNSLFSKFAIAACRKAVIKDATFSEKKPLKVQHHLDLLDNILSKNLKPDLQEPEKPLVTLLSNIASNLIATLDESADYIELGSPQKIRTAFDIKSAALELLGISVYYNLSSTEDAVGIVEGCLESPSSLYSSIVIPAFKLGSYLSLRNESIVGPLTRAYPSVASSPLMSSDVIIDTTKAFAKGLKTLSQDLVVSVIYTLINMLAADSDHNVIFVGSRRPRTFLPIDQLSINTNGSGAQTPTSVSSNNNPQRNVSQYTIGGGEASNFELQDVTVQNIIRGAVALSSAYDDRQIGALTATVLTQKVGKVNSMVDREVTLGLSVLAPSLTEKEFRFILKTFSSAEARAFKLQNHKVVQTIKEARCNLAESLSVSHPLYQVYLSDLLSGIISKGDVQQLEHHRSHQEISAAAEKIALLLPPLAKLLPKSPEEALDVKDWPLFSLFRDAWFNMVVHGFAANSPLTKEHYRDLYVIARSTPPLVSETSANKVESEIELNTVLRRGSSNSNVSNQKGQLNQALSLHNLEWRSVSYPKVMFLAAANLLESFRVASGNFSKVLLYFGDPSFQKEDSSKYMANIAIDISKKYVQNILKGGKAEFTTDNVAEQLKEALVLCCHRVRTIQDVAFSSAEMIITQVPSSLCRATSLYTLLDLLTLLWMSVLDAETDEYEPQTTFHARKSNVDIQLSDSYQHRRETLQKLKVKTKLWTSVALEYMSYDMKSLLTGYLSSMGEYYPMNYVSLGYTIALELGGTINQSDSEISYISTDKIVADSSAGFLSQYIWRIGAKQSLSIRDPKTALVKSAGTYSDAIEKLERIAIGEETTYIPISQLRDLLFAVCRHLKNDVTGLHVTHLAVVVPFNYFTERYIQLGISLWLWIASEYPLLREPLLAEISIQWEISVVKRKGIFSRANDLPGPEYSKMEYAPSNKQEIDLEQKNALKTFAPHLELIRFLSSFFQSSIYDSRHVLSIFTRIATVGLDGLKTASLHPIARPTRFELIKFGLDILGTHTRLHNKICDYLKRVVLEAALTWFEQPAHWPFGGNKLRLRHTITLLKDAATQVEKISISKGDNVTRNQKQLLLLFLNDELTKMSAWVDPLQINNNYKESFGKRVLNLSGSITTGDIDSAWRLSPGLAVFLVERYRNDKKAVSFLQQLVSKDPLRVSHIADALKYYIVIPDSSKHGATTKAPDLKALLYWANVSPIESVNLFSSSFGRNSFVTQYAMRSLESHDVNITFYYVPQIVQSLREDKSGYVERYILQTAKISQLFCHQIIWNILANSYRDEDSTDPDPMKPTLDRVISKMTSSFDPEEKSFYDKEFGFFNEVTSISGKLKPYIKKSKGEKKAKIDEEMDKIKLHAGVYLPSNPDGIVVDIDRRSGKPLQSHAKAPFLAKFKIRKEIKSFETDDVSGSQTPVDADASQSTSAIEGSDHKRTIDVWQGAIFKVGDDCRQDLLALQIIGVFRSIFNASGLDLYVFPYRVTATAPGCGVIDVLPNSISRDMLGREAVNGLYEYFTSKFGGEDSIEFQKARNNLVKSLAGYSVISYLIQFKDRHNGNIMYDNEGHILHIDFGFCFDIVPGGVKFEAAPFKLTSEMVAVMGGSTDTQAYKWFEELCVKAFLASRPYCELFVAMVIPMLASGLPCFKGEKTIRNLRNRFALEKTEKEAALHFRGLIRKSFESYYTKGYDEFQRITNGIPY